MHPTLNQGLPTDPYAPPSRAASPRKGPIRPPPTRKGPVREPPKEKVPVEDPTDEEEPNRKPPPGEEGPPVDEPPAKERDRWRRVERGSPGPLGVAAPPGAGKEEVPHDSR
jgi:hypothetical protein